MICLKTHTIRKVKDRVVRCRQTGRAGGQAVGCLVILENGSKKTFRHICYCCCSCCHCCFNLFVYSGLNAMSTCKRCHFITQWNFLSLWCCDWKTEVILGKESGRCVAHIKSIKKGVISFVRSQLRLKKYGWHFLMLESYSSCCMQSCMKWSIQKKAVILSFDLLSVKSCT